ncbi:MAG: family 43 glycosylhydrolase, partial [Bacteroidota bacterium]
TNDTLGVNDTALVWQSVPGASSYRVLIAIDSTLFTILMEDTSIVGDTLLSLQHLIGTKLRVGGKYFWHVSASDSSGVSLYSAIWSFIPIPIRQFIPGAFWYDTNNNLIEAHGGGLLYDDSSKTYYWYGEGRTTSSNYAIGVSCYSSKNLYSWKFEGIVLPASATNSGGATPVLERPKVIYNDSTKKYVMWMHIDSPDYAYAQAGVAVSDCVTGPFHYLGSERPNNAMSRDMTLFKDDDGKAYLIYSSENNATMYISLLTSDYLHQSGTYARNLINESREAPAMFKYDNTYFLVTSGTSGWAPNAAKYATASSPLGQWVLNGNPCVGTNANTTFGGQSTYVLPVQGKAGDFIFMADKWNSSNLPSSTYIWLPFQVKNNQVTIQWFDTWDLSALSPTLGVESGIHTTPRTYSLSQNYPNPFNPSTCINVDLPQAGLMSLTIYNMLGKVVQVVDKMYRPAGQYVCNVNMDKFTSGVYFYTLRQWNESNTKKMLLLK